MVQPLRLDRREHRRAVPGLLPADDVDGRVGGQGARIGQHLRVAELTEHVERRHPDHLLGDRLDRWLAGALSGVPRSAELGSHPSAGLDRLCPTTAAPGPAARRRWRRRRCSRKGRSRNRAPSRRSAAAAAPSRGRARLSPRSPSFGGNACACHASGAWGADRGLPRRVGGPGCLGPIGQESALTVTTKAVLQGDAPATSGRYGEEAEEVVDVAFTSSVRGEQLVQRPTGASRQ